MSKKFASVGLAVDRPKRVLILHPGTNQVLCEKDENGTPIPGKEAYLDVLSGDSPKARSLQDSIGESRSKLRPGQRLTADELRDEQAATVAQLVVGWNVLDLDGKPTNEPFSFENAKELFTTDGCDFWREQGFVGVNTRANFIPAPATRSVNGQ